MDRAEIITIALALAFVGVTAHLIWEMVLALRYGYFRYTFVTGWLFRDTDRDGQPILFWIIFTFHALQMLVFLGMSLMFGRAIVSSLLR